jgi:hypothetical protein
VVVIEKNKQKNRKKKTMFEPVLNDLEVKWLKITEEEFFPVEKNKPIAETLKNPTEPEIRLTFTTVDSGLWKCRRCHGLVKSPESEPYYCTECERDSDFDNFTEPIDPHLWRLPTWIEIKTEDIDMQNTYLDILNFVKKSLVLHEEMLYKILTLWIIATWKTGCWDTVPFLMFRGLVESGKTRALDILRELGYRTIHSSGLSSKAMFRFTDVYEANVLLDEIDNKIDRRTESGREMIDYLKPSYRNGSYYYVANRENQRKIEKYKNFGFKAFAGEKGGFDDAIFSRSIDYKMEQDYPEILELKDEEKEIDRIRTILLNYRYKTNNPLELPENFPFKGRIREIYSCIIRTAIHIGIEYNDIIDYINESVEEKHEELENSNEYQILKILREYEAQPTLDDAPETISYSDIAEKLGWDSEKRQKLGYIFKKKLMLKTKRWGQGTVLLLNEKKNVLRLKHLYRRFRL